MCHFGTYSTLSLVNVEICGGTVPVKASSQKKYLWYKKTERLRKRRTRPTLNHNYMTNYTTNTQ